MSDPRAKEPAPPFPAQSQPHPGETGAMEPKPDHGEESYRGIGRLQGRVALITGGDSGIGRAVALAYAREGADVAIGFLQERADAEESGKWIERAGRRLLLEQGDLALPSACQNLVERTVATLGRLDILVNNAAHQGSLVERFEALDDERVERTFQANILAMFRLVRAALPHLRPGSSIINVASIQAYEPTPGILDYAATKGAIVTFTKGLAKELGERGIRVNAVAPGPVWTPLVAQSFPPEKNARFGGDTPLGRPAQPAELAPTFVFLASDEARYINGEILGVTGGRPLP